MACLVPTCDFNSSNGLWRIFFLFKEVVWKKEEMTIEQFLAEGLEIEKKATEGPWVSTIDAYPRVICASDARKEIVDAGDHYALDDAQEYNDTEFIADARTRISKQREVIEVLVESLTEYAEECNCRNKPVNYAANALRRAEEIVNGVGK